MTLTEKFRNLPGCALLAIACVAAIASCQQAKKPSANKQGGSKPDNAMLFRKYNLDKIVLPTDFTIAVYAEVPNARSLALGSNGIVFVSNRNEDNVYAVADDNHDGKADTVYIIATGLNTPNGVAFSKGSLFVAEINRILRFDNIEDKLANPPAFKVVYDKLPTKTHHGWKFLAAGPDGKLYFNVGAPCNVCNEKDSIFATIARINTDGSGLEVYARGVRNSVGFDWHPQTGHLWFTDNGRDDLGDNIPYCELNHAPAKGLHFGFPYIHQGDIADPTYGKGKKPADYVKPALKVGPHAAPLGMRFYTGNMFPDNYKHAIFIAEHGSWNRSVPYGYQVKAAFLQGDTVVAYNDFATGWLQNNKKVLGRPVDVLQMPDGALLISDDMNGVIYRVAYKKANNMSDSIAVMNVSAGEEVAGMWITRPVEGIGQYKLIAKKRKDGVYEWAHYVQRASGMIDNVYRGEVPVSTDLEKVLTALNNALTKAYGPLVQLHKATYTMRDAVTGKEIGKA